MCMIQRHLELFIFQNKWKCDILFDRRNERIWTNFRLDEEIKFLQCEFFYYASFAVSYLGPVCRSSRKTMAKSQN